VTSHRLWLTLPLLCCLALAGATRAFAMLPPTHPDETPIAVDGMDDGIRLAQASQAAPKPTPSPIPAASPLPAAQPAASDEPIGNVASLTGTATVIRNKDPVAIKLKDDIYLNDTVQTSSGSSLGVTFSDDTTFHLSANAKITIDTYVYDPNGKQNKGVFDIGKGTVAFVAAAVAKTGDMQITTPAATLGIRGTTGVVDVPEGAAAGGAVDNIKLYPDADGRVGHIDVNDRVSGARLGSLTQGASGFAVRPGVGGARATAAPLTISPQQAARDQGIVRQVHATQSVGRQIVSEQRAIRRANPPAGNQNRGKQPPRQPGQQQPGQKQPGGQKQQPGAPKRQGSQQPGQPERAGQNGQPGQGERAGQNAKPGEPGQGQPQRAGQGPTPPAGAASPQPAAQPRQGGATPAPNIQRPPAAKPAAQRPKPPPAPKKKKR
jgi:hypothetical protein